MTLDDGAQHVRTKEFDLKKRTKKFALNSINLVGTLPGNVVCQVVGRQMIKAGTSVGANYRSACRAKSKADFVNKLAICEEEADESVYWLEILIESGHADSPEIHQLRQEANELTAIMSASRKTAKRGL